MSRLTGTTALAMSKKSMGCDKKRENCNTGWEILKCYSYKDLVQSALKEEEGEGEETKESERMEKEKREAEMAQNPSKSFLQKVIASDDKAAKGEEETAAAAASVAQNTPLPTASDEKRKEEMKPDKPVPPPVAARKTKKSNSLSQEDETKIYIPQMTVTNEKEEMAKDRRFDVV